MSGFGSAVAPIDNSISVAEEFIELRAPLVQDHAAAKDLLVDTGYRRSDYSTAGVTNTYKFEVQYAPIADYRILHEIGVIPYLVVLSDCANTGNPMYCSQIVRQPTNGSLTGNTVAGGGYVIQKNYNLGTALNSGVDVQMNYHLDLPPGFGGVSFALNGSYLLHNETQPLPGAHTYDCAGLFGATCETVNPHWHHLFRTTWDTPWEVSSSLTWRYIGKVEEDNNTSDPTLKYASYGAYDYANARIPAFNYLDLEVTWNVNRILQIRAGANNILDKDPPVVNTYVVAGGAANTYSTYDMFGRQLFLAFTAKL